MQSSEGRLDYLPLSCSPTFKQPETLTNPAAKKRWWTSWLFRYCCKPWFSKLEKAVWFLEACQHQSFCSLNILCMLKYGSLYLAGTSLTLRTVFSALHSVSHKWFSIGLELDVAESQLNIIETDGHGVEERMRTMLDYWLSNAAVPSWKDLVDALKKKHSW